MVNWQNKSWRGSPNMKQALQKGFDHGQEVVKKLTVFQENFMKKYGSGGY